MAFWLGKVDIQEKDLSKFFRERKKLMEYYLDEMKLRIIIKLNLEELKEFEKAVIQKYGSFSSLHSKKAAQTALKQWIQEILRK